MGTLFRFSGLHEFISLMVAPLLNDERLRLLIIGEGEQLECLVELVRANGLQKNVIFVGRIEYDLLADFLRLGSVAVLPFRSELVTNCALPGKVLQYVSCGLPTVASSLGGLRSLFQNGQGVIYAGSTAEMVSKVLDLLSVPEQRKAVSVRGREHLRLMFNWERQIQEFEALLKGVVSNSR